MQRFLLLSIAMLLWQSTAFANATDSINIEETVKTPLNLQQCIDIALVQSAKIAQANANIEEYRARLSEVQANYYPKLSVLSYVAPMFTVIGDALTPDVERKFDLGSWGPSTRLETLLAMPIYTFGRLEAGERAAKARLDVEVSRLREAENLVKVEITKFYYTHLYAQTLLPHLNRAHKRLSEITQKAEILYAESSGKVSKVDLTKLAYAESEISKFIFMAKEGAELSLSALKHSMGLTDSVNLKLSEKKIPRPAVDTSLDDIKAMIKIAENNRPEWKQIKAGVAAASALRASEKLANRPVVFVAGTFEASWSPTREDTKNPYQYDPFNNIFGGVAIGLKLDLDWALRKSKIDAANAKLMQVNALKKLAITGIPLQIKKARSDVMTYQEIIKQSRKAQKAANKWVIFAAAAYTSGTGEVKDVLEGMAATLKAKRDYYEGMLNYYVAFAELDYALGK